MLPVVPELDDPVKILTAPETPEEATVPVLSIIAPDPELELEPETIRTAPDVADTDDPLMRVTEPPTPWVPGPLTTDTEPARPPVAPPVARTIAPEFPEADAPLTRDTAPETPVDKTSAVTTETVPEPDEVLAPLEIVTLPPSLALDV